MIPADYGTPERLIKYALIDAGKLSRDGTPDSSQLLDGMNRLADILYFQQTQGLKLWLLEDITVPLVDGQATYTFGPGGDLDMRKPFRVEFGYAADSSVNRNRREIDPIAYVDYTRLSNVTQTGLVTQYFVDKRLDMMNVSLWLVPNAEQVLGEVHLVMRTKAAHLENLTDAMTFPPEWYMGLRWALALEFATGQPIAIQQRCQMFSEKYLAALEGFDIEDASMQVQADQSQTSGGSFR
jgi:hypothetical protein